MSLESSKVLHAHFLKIGRTIDAANLEQRFPELAVKPEPVKEVPKKEVKKDGSSSNRSK